MMMKEKRLGANQSINAIQKKLPDGRILAKMEYSNAEVFGAITKKNAFTNKIEII